MLTDRAEADQLLERARFEVYRQASTSWEDSWRVARVADLEELFAERLWRTGNARGAYRAWRAAGWVRHLLARTDDGEDLLAHSRAVLEHLEAAI
ncbi:MAG: hypothetical protein KTR31_15390 [Myxococcales bacterium]|nr:hypothetical protein [Myxococcales bacterium]